MVGQCVVVFEDLDRDRTLQLLVAGQQDYPLTAGVDEALDFEPADMVW
jgi:hypothetical protein